jgi:hypothetical protein
MAAALRAGPRAADITRSKSATFNVDSQKAAAASIKSTVSSHTRSSSLSVLWPSLELLFSS